VHLFAHLLNARNEMELLAYLKTLFAYDDWANHEALRSLRTIPTPPRAVKVMAHIVNTEWLWMSRLKQDGHQVVVWPKYGLDEAEQQLPVLRSAWGKYLDTRTTGDLERSVEYVNSKGEQYRNPVQDMLMHVVMHGAYHRGQIAAQVRQAGGEPAYTDFIEAARKGKL
jgi:uncharacterized damage-inducible protein DinB